MEKTLILDLDDTIFETRSMDPKAFEGFFKHLANALSATHSPDTIRQISEDLWTHTWDVVMDKYRIKKDLLLRSIQELDRPDLELSIKPYADYAFIRSYPIRKFLVTTSVTGLQLKKIKALEIENDFDAIIINDPFKEKKSKNDIFRELVSSHRLMPSLTYVVGDNNDSEIRAGKRLGMVTVQMLRPNVRKGADADHYITSFEELGPILTR